MTDDIKVSVFCIAFNHEKYIRQALQSVVAQKTNFKYEILVHDDASTDGTAEIIMEFAEKYPDLIIPIIQTENQYSKRINISNTHLRPRARGKYIATCECDDFWVDENKLQQQYDVMENNPEISMCVHKVVGVNEDGTPNALVHPEEKYGINGSGYISQNEFADYILLKGGYPFHTSSYFRKVDWKTEKVITGLPKYLNGDQRILYAALNDGPIYYIDKVMSHRRLMAIGSYNSRLVQKSDAERFQIFINSIMAEIDFDKLSDKKFHKKIVESVYLHFFFFFRTRDIKMTKKYFKKVQKQLAFDWKISKGLNAKYLLMKICPSIIPMVFNRNK
ncbi:MAG: glycosyltransferase family 2 protein [Eubacteriales bacterium]|nr:glycosyltransferase family 2 protein [Eubacteriales bacterium]